MSTALRALTRIAARPTLRRAVRDGLAIAGVMALVLTLAGVIPFQGERIGWSYARDLYAYWVADPADPYGNPVGVGFAYVYSPLFMQLTLPMKALPFDVVAALWLVAGVAALWWLRALWMLAIPGVSSDLLLGNVNVFIAVAIVLAIQRPAFWAVPLLTKLTPAVGGVWHLARREWAATARGVAIGAVLVAASVFIQPAAWAGWIDVLTSSMGSRAESTAEFGPLLVRLPLAAAIAVAAALTVRPWMVPLAAFVAMPVIWPATLAVLTAIPRLATARREEAAAARPAVSAESTAAA